MVDFISYIHSILLDPARFSIILAAMLLTAIVGIVTGPMHGNANPFFWKVINILFGGVGIRLDRKERRRSDLMFRGLFITVIALALSLFIGKTLAGLSVMFPFRGASEAIFLSLTMTSGAVWFGLLKLYFALKEKKLSEGVYYTIAHSARTNLSLMDDYGITRTAMGYAARSFDKGLVAPAIWYLIAGLPGAFLYSGLVALAWRFGRDGSGTGFGAVFIALEKLMGFIPAILSGFLMAAGGLFTPTGGIIRAFFSLIRVEGVSKYQEGGLPVTAMAHSLNVSLGGTVTDIEGHVIKRSWVGPEGATAKIEYGHLRRCIYIVLMAYLLFAFSLVFAMLYAGRLF